MQLNSYYDELLSKGIHIIGIAGQNLKNIQQFVDKEEIKIPIASDKDRSIIKKYEIFVPIKWDSFQIAIPSTYILDQEHIIRYSYIGDSQFDRPVIEEIENVLKTLPTES